MFRDAAANWLAFKGWMAPISSGITSQLGVRCCGRHLVAKVTFYCGLSARQLVASAVQLSAVAAAEGVDAEAVDWLVRTLDFGKQFEVSDKKMKEMDRTF